MESPSSPENKKSENKKSENKKSSEKKKKKRKVIGSKKELEDAIEDNCDFNILME